MRRFMLTGIAGLLCAVMAHASQAATYLFQETSSMVPGLFVSSSITINGGFADLPTLSNAGPGPYDFGNLVSFDLILPISSDQSHYSLADFIAMCFPVTCGGGISNPSW